jgi:hypothetical protein
MLVLDPIGDSALIHPDHSYFVEARDSNILLGSAGTIKVLKYWNDLVEEHCKNV